MVASRPPLYHTGAQVAREGARNGRLHNQGYGNPDPNRRHRNHGRTTPCQERSSLREAPRWGGRPALMHRRGQCGEPAPGAQESNSQDDARAQHLMHQRCATESFHKSADSSSEASYHLHTTPGVALGHCVGKDILGVRLTGAPWASMIWKGLHTRVGANLGEADRHRRFLPATSFSEACDPFPSTERVMNIGVMRSCARLAKVWACVGVPTLSHSFSRGPNPTSSDPSHVARSDTRAPPRAAA